MHVVVTETEMVADFVDEDVGDYVLERIGSFMPEPQDRQAVEEDTVNLATRIEEGFPGHIDAVVEAEKTVRAIDPKLGQDLLLRQVGGLDQDVAAQAPELDGDPPVGLLSHMAEGVGIGVGAGAVPDGHAR